ncbi:hypothetical protein BU25DRAFT_45440 [Macroventuria anomochaeta]|uniref:Uncharacterized protein n=1 Tax=Macroventuria anomochaeta TaxID=301207 RepID=A0ACB6S380_9PLEO|nr:uncharacterized protein BU25DRAFT_45440 [Macroventuria anomochaeta]KAF2627854.1 hypothetical protein BU25DRAFT_45440 [Macroventuria anomochaeta]
MMSILQPEAGIFYGVCWFLVIVRLVSRRLHRGAWKRLQWDDYLIVCAMLTDTVLLVCTSKVVTTSSNLIPPDEDVSQYSQAEIDSRISGSKYVLVVEQMQIATIWLVKACLLIMYFRMTAVLPQRKLVIATSIYVAVTFIVMEILYFGVWCRPFSQYFAVPTISTQCSAATNHLITNAVFNISSDIIILSIPMPLLFRVRLPKKNKLILIGIFLIGLFTVVAAVLNKYYSFSNPFGRDWVLWYLRESYTALLCANLPLTYPLIQRVFKLRNWNSYSDESHSIRASNTRGTNTFSTARSHSHWVSQSKRSKSKYFRDDLRSAESQEDINDPFRNPTADDGPQFITSAIEMDGVKSYEKSLTDLSIDTPTSWRTEQDRKKDFNYNAPT